jgi:transcriptional regulator GlxA family with amidase domain
MRRQSATRVQVLVLEDCTPLPSIGVADLLRKAIELAASMSIAPRRQIEVSLVAVSRRARVRAAGGVEIRCDATVHDAEPGDVVVASALDPDVIARLEKNRAAVDFLRRAYDGGADVLSLCTGAFLLAEAGLLDGRDAATHWAFQDLLAARHPRVRIVPQAVVVDHGRVVTAGGATSFLPMTLLLIERLLGAEVARAASKMFLIDVNKSPQGAYAMFASQTQHTDEGVRRAQRRIEERLADVPGVEELARVAGTSVRTFARRFRRATGNAPREYVQRVRVEAAKRALEGGGESVAEIAARVGYGDPAAFRKLFVAQTGLTPSEYRARYGARATPAWITRTSAARRSRAAGSRATAR